MVKVMTRGAEAIPIGVLTKPMAAGDTLTVVPLPLSATTCGEPDALSAILTAPARAPDATGLKLTVIVQLAFAARLAPQLSVCVNELAFVPVIVIPVIDSVAVPSFVRVIGIVAADVPRDVSGNARVVGDKLTVKPVPVSATVCGEP